MAALPKTSEYLIALGSNQRQHQHGAPEQVLRAALADLAPLAAARIIQSAPLGPSRRRYANTAAIIRSTESPPELLARLHQIEEKFGRRRSGQRWSARVLDLDIVLWSEGAWCSSGLTIPHTQFRRRTFVLAPAVAIAPRWRDPITGLSLNHLFARLTRNRPIPRAPLVVRALSSVGRATDF
jgi:2-amino-4-hydroxy-6-hydroxymethyldihydropteridine diphosphokinase